MLTVTHWVTIPTGLKAGWSSRRIAAHIGRAPFVVSREIRGNSTNTGGQRLVAAQCRAQRSRSRPQLGTVAGDEGLRTPVLADLGRSRIPRQIADRVALEAGDASVGTVSHSPAAGSSTASGEAI